MSAPIEHGDIEVNGVRLHVASAGSGPPMLFLHGFPEFWYAWRRQLEDFSRDHRAVAPDLRGYNLSDKPAEPAAYRPKRLIEDVRQLVGHLGGRATVVAHDWGGAIAWGLAARHPELVDKLVIVNAPHPVLFARDLAHDPAQQAASRYMLLFRDPKAERVLSENGHARLAAMMAGWGGALPKEDLARYKEAWSRPGALSGGLNWYRASPLYPPTPEDPGAAALALDPAEHVVRVPTLVIWGERDPALLPGLLDGLDALVPRLTVARIPEGSHWVVREFPARVNALIRDFI